MTKVSPNSSNLTSTEQKMFKAMKCQHSESNKLIEVKACNAFKLSFAVFGAKTGLKSRDPIKEIVSR